MASFGDFFKRNIKFILLAFSLIAEAVVAIPFNEYIYYSGIVFVAYYAVNNNASNNKFGLVYFLFLLVCFISSCLALNLDIRLFAFAFLIIVFTPITNSFKIFVFRKKYLYYCLMLFPVLSVVSLFCYIFDINYYIADDARNANSLDFSAIFPHPIWLGTALGLSNVVLAWLVLGTKNKLQVCVYAVLLLLSIYLSVVAASRSAFFASIFVLITFIILRLHNLKKIMVAGLVICVITIALLPFYITGSKRMQAKFELAEGKYGSRTELFMSGFAGFEKHPVLGQGFAIRYNTKGEKQVGRMETGSGWISVLSQTGLVGLSLVCVLILNVRRVFPYLFIDNKLLLFFSCFLYLCLQSCFEGYLLTVGYYPCILFWTLLGFLHVYPYYTERMSKCLKFLVLKRENRTYEDVC